MTHRSHIVSASFKARSGRNRKKPNSCNNSNRNKLNEIVRPCSSTSTTTVLSSTPFTTQSSNDCLLVTRSI
ncbi:hypothetical protein J6590_068690 [Homalodisca vitripennis]|nr:hypothetical protein J6590_068690 [Homalodisca vitripennis]